jgi:DNA-binding CsgD family transcriptional regulator
MAYVEPKLLTRPDARSSAVVQALLQDTHLPLALIDASGVYRYCSTDKARLLGTTPDKVIGQNVAQVLGKDLAAERMEQVAAATGSGRPMLVECTLFGTQTRTVIRPIPGSADSPALALVVHHVGHASANVAPDRAMYDVVRSRIAPPIPVAQLTARERDVLALIAQGYTQAQIAEQLGRSVKTIEWHRASLGKKLGVGTAVELSHIAYQNGLVPLSGPFASARSGSRAGPGTSPPSGEQSPDHAS